MLNFESIKTLETPKKKNQLAGKIKVFNTKIKPIQYNVITTRTVLK